MSFLFCTSASTCTVHCPDHEHFFFTETLIYEQQINNNSLLAFEKDFTRTCRVNTSCYTVLTMFLLYMYHTHITCRSFWLVVQFSSANTNFSGLICFVFGHLGTKAFLHCKRNPTYNTIQYNTKGHLPCMFRCFILITAVDEAHDSRTKKLNKKLHVCMRAFQGHQGNDLRALRCSPSLPLWSIRPFCIVSILEFV